MVLWGELRVEATLENLRKVSEFVRDIGQQLQLTEDAMFDVELAVEEASANIVRHAYRPGQAGDILLRVETTDDVVREAELAPGGPNVLMLSKHVELRRAP